MMIWYERRNEEKERQRKKKNEKRNIQNRHPHMIEKHLHVCVMSRLNGIQGARGDLSFSRILSTWLFNSHSPFTLVCHQDRFPHLHSPHPPRSIGAASLLVTMIMCAHVQLFEHACSREACLIYAIEVCMIVGAIAVKQDALTKRARACQSSGYQRWHNRWGLDK